ncbi:YfhO family protein [Candidatus Sumerlaeota bacterium]|nr:YfhO family protein [Candidatus Sumerlaeota bacterium]
MGCRSTLDPRSNRLDARTDAVCIAALVALAVLAFVHVLARAGGEVLGSPVSDILMFFHPMRDYANAELRVGRLPLWNPHLFCGLPMHAEGQVGLFYPTFLATFFLPASLALDLSALVHFAATGVFLYLYLRAIGLSPFASFFGGFAYQFSAATTMRLFGGLVSMIPALALVPALLFVWEKWRATGRREWLVWGALGYGCLILAGHPQIFFYSSLCLAWHVAFGVGDAWRRGGARRALQGAIGFGAIVALGVGVGAAQLFPTLDFVSRSSRGGNSYEFCTSVCLLPENFLTLVAPGLFGDMLRTAYWGRDLLWEMNFYVGILPLALALATIVRPGSVPLLGHALLVPVLILIALGRYSPVFDLMYRWVPLFDSFRGLAKLFIFVQISLCVLAAAGLEQLVRRSCDDPRARGIRLRALCALVGVLVVGAAMLSVFGPAPDEVGSAWRGLQDWRFEHRLSYDSFDRAAMGSPTETWDVASFWIWRMMLVAAGGLVVLAGWRRIERRGRWMRAALLAVLIPDLFLFCRSYLVTSPKTQADLPSPFAEVLREEKEPFRLYVPALPGNPTLPARIENVRGHTGLFLGRVLDYFVNSGRYHGLVTPLTGGLPSVMTGQMVYPNVRYVVFSPDLAGDARELEPVTRVGDLELYKIRTDSPRAYFAVASGIVPVRSRAEGIEAFNSPPAVEFPVHQATLVETSAEDAITSIGSPGPRDSIRFVRRDPSRIVLAVSASGPRLLVVTDAYDKDWECRLDGREDIDIFPVNLAFRGVVIPSGTHRVEFVYRPTAFYVGSVVSVLSLAALLSVLRLGVRKSEGVVEPEG